MISRISGGDCSGKISSNLRRHTMHRCILILARTFLILISLEWHYSACGFKSIHNDISEIRWSWKRAIKNRRIFKYRIRSHMHTHTVALQQGYSIRPLRYVNGLISCCETIPPLIRRIRWIRHSVHIRYDPSESMLLSIDARFIFFRTHSRQRSGITINTYLLKLTPDCTRKKSEFFSTIVMILIASISATIVSDLFIVCRQCLKDTRSSETIHSSKNLLYMRTRTDCERRETILINAILSLIIRLWRLTSVLVHFLLGKARPSSRCFFLSLSLCFPSLVNRRMDSTFSAHIQRPISTGNTDDYSFSLSLFETMHRDFFSFIDDTSAHLHDISFFLSSKTARGTEAKQ
jgi:hypothetical protein